MTAMVQFELLPGVKRPTAHGDQKVLAAPTCQIALEDRTIWTFRITPGADVRRLRAVLGLCVIDVIGRSICPGQTIRIVETPRFSASRRTAMAAFGRFEASG